MKILKELSNFADNPWVVIVFLGIIFVSFLVWAIVWKRQTGGNYKPPQT